MLHRIAFFFFPMVFAALVAAATSNAEEVNLFEGNSLDAWRGYQQESVPAAWKLEDGVLTCEGPTVGLITREQFGDFDLRFDWKIAKGGNSGVIYRVTEEGDHAYSTGPEYQVLDDAAHNIESDDSTASASIYALYPRSVDASKPAGKWNEGRILVRDGNVQHWLNGKQVVDAEWGSEDWKDKIAHSKFADWPGFAQSKQGHIALQYHGSPVWYRNMRIKPLQGKTTVDADRPARILFVTQSSGFRHPTVTRKPHQLSHTERVMKELGVRSGAFRVDCTQDVANDFTPELMANYDVVAFYTTGDLPIPDETLDWFLNDWLKQPGHGFLGLHSATDTYHNYKPYWDMIGGTFNGHPWRSGSTVTVRVNDPDHPAMKPWIADGEEFVITDEIYQHKHWQPEKVRVLMSLDVEKSLGAASTGLKPPYQVPVCWVKSYGEGRAMHMSLGHREDVWDNEKYQQSLLGGIRWLLGKAPGDSTPNPDLSAEEEAKARQAVEASQAVKQ